MHAVVEYALINQRVLLVTTQRGEEQTKPGTRDQKAPCSFFVLCPKFERERGANKFPSEAIY
jgi:hypothetical protein